jgi:hypothetical protein
MQSRQAIALDDAALAEIERLYRGSELTVVAIGVRFGRSGTGISKLARQHGWPMRWERRGCAPRKSGPSAAKARALLAHRLCEAITKKLDQMEKDMASGELSSEDFERDAKSVTSMIGAMNKVAATGTDADTKQKPKSAEPAEPDAASEAERISREIVERFERIQRRREAERGSG